MKVYKVYQVKFRDGYSKKTYIVIVAASSDIQALVIAMNLETSILSDGTVLRPAVDYFCCEVIEGVYSKKEGLKSVINFQ